MKIVIIFAVVINAIAYSYQILSWKTDCKAYGKDNLAFSLGEIIGTTFTLVTCPCIVGMIISR